MRVRAHGRPHAAREVVDAQERALEAEVVLCPKSNELHQHRDERGESKPTHPGVSTNELRNNGVAGLIRGLCHVDEYLPEALANGGCVKYYAGLQRERAGLELGRGGVRGGRARRRVGEEGHEAGVLLDVRVESG